MTKQTVEKLEEEAVAAEFADEISDESLDRAESKLCTCPRCGAVDG